MLGIQFNKPKLLLSTQSDTASNKKANEKLIIIVVKVKKKLGIACFAFL